MERLNWGKICFQAYSSCCRINLLDKTEKPNLWWLLAEGQPPLPPRISTHCLATWVFSTWLLASSSCKEESLDWVWESLWASLVAQTVKSLPTMWETRVWSLDWEDPLEKEMATHSSIHAWKIPWTEKSGGLQSVELQRVRHDCHLGFTHTHTHITHHLALGYYRKTDLGWYFFVVVVVELKYIQSQQERELREVM